MKPNPLKSRMANLPEAEQDALAHLALMEMKKRSQLERIAAGSVWTKLGLMVPIVVSVAFLGFRGSFADMLPIIIIFLLFIILGVSTSVHARIDAVYELMKMDRQRNDAPDNPAESAPMADR